jgi:hypothetical protein
MKLSEFKKLTKHLPDDLELKIEHMVPISDVMSVTKTPVNKEDIYIYFGSIIIRVR